MPFLAYRVFGWESVEITPDWNMRDLPLGRTQAMCNTLACTSCGLLFLDMRFDPEEMSALYADYRGDDYAATRGRFEPGYEWRNAILNEGSRYIETVEELLAPYLSSTPRVLDWGGDTGINTPFRGRASLHHVYDISNKPPVDGAEIVDREGILSAEYDLVVSSNVLEHVPAPGDALEEIVSVMGPETVLYIEVPHEDVVRLVPCEADRIRAKRHWHEHVNFFTEPAIDAMLARAGLEQITRVSHQVSAGGKDSHVFSVVAKRRADHQPSTPTPRP
ncbi:class I SAM-dependent methyltransferase [Enterovirga aerilata]|uniref:Class I SAM-dependent methyltransferase n=1 Tax=Enterovirga aerilata TaxID=2730920 RepID=A0A849IB66_9HYPH|nr:class I SAM-dependent methyltransferase [Enterovirga sp. DB1703]NNM74531.1 class I SAM-dependent methyltransferase [Enterovirga sp. DB1703]